MLKFFIENDQISSNQFRHKPRGLCINQLLFIAVKSFYGSVLQQEFPWFNPFSNVPVHLH